MQDQPPIKPELEPVLKRDPEFTPQQLVKMLLELGPLVIFFLVNSQRGIFWGTACFMVATAIALAASWRILGRIPVMPLVSGACILVFGGLTLVLQDELFIKMKPTIVNGLFASLLLGGLAFGQTFIKVAFGEVFNLTDEGWRVLTVRWALFFILLGIINEVVWRTFSTDFWISFKVWGVMPMTMVFAIAQLGVIKRHEAEPKV